MTSPPQSHGGICDFAPAFRNALRDIYESVAGLTLYDVSGKRGWALSKNRSPRQSTQDKGGIVPQGGAVNEQLFKFAAQQQYVPGDRHVFSALPILRDRKGRNTIHDDWRRGNKADSDHDDKCYFKILNLLDDPRDLRAAAMVNKSFYRCYLRNKTALLEGARGTLIDGIAEVEGTPCGTTAVPGGGSGAAAVAAGISSHEKFKDGELLVMEEKNLAEADTNKYPRDIRRRLAGLSLKGATGPGRELLAGEMTMGGGEDWCLDMAQRI
ncbi:hypothetical protein NPX13_g9405 [Xylaria arbuscula]|uniref:Uncharacterized protein n=1 Tax=Xylaria arbuscula TaxID=114810 RepID=A0A9W8N6W3_9PEZI|nr:hypothetical protein NPX13_g9405 [Xylaria arbuscula]